MHQHQVLYNLAETIEMITQGRPLILAGDEQLLRQLPAGRWIGGTTPYFIAEQGGLSTRDKIYVTELPDFVESVAVKTYDETTISEVHRDIPENGFAFIIIPANCHTHLSFALNDRSFDRFGAEPLIGWVSGMHLDDLGKVTPKVFDGKRGLGLENQAVVMHVRLPENKLAKLGIMNIFDQGSGDTITFPSDGFTVTESLINGQKRNFADYVTEKGLAPRLPLVGNYRGTFVNVSFQNVDISKGEVTFYGPVFKGIEYRHAKRLAYYVSEFTKRMPTDTEHIIFSCNCILNYVYSKLEGQQTGGIMGPVTFGEIACRLLNQTMVYLSIYDRPDARNAPGFLAPHPELN